MGGGAVGWRCTHMYVHMYVCTHVLHKIRFIIRFNSIAGAPFLRHLNHIFGDFNARVHDALEEEIRLIGSAAWGRGMDYLAQAPPEHLDNRH